ncbi:hypothetical protein Tco_1372444 [Tanacetum coccineum]
MLQKISECKRSVYFLRGEIRHAIMNIDQLNGLIEMMEVMEFTLELYDSVWCLRDMVKAKNKRLLGLNKHLVDAEEDIRANERLSLDEGGLHALMYFILVDVYDMPIIDEVVFKIHKKGVFAFDPLRNTNYKRATVNGKAKMVEVVAPVQENVDVGIKQEDRRRKIVLGSMAPANFVKNPVVSASMGQGSSVKSIIKKGENMLTAKPKAMKHILKCPSTSVSMYVTESSLANFKL